MIIIAILLLLLLLLLFLPTKNPVVDWGDLKEGDHWRDPDVEGRIILRWIFRKLDVRV